MFDRSRQNFETLSDDEKREAITRMATEGHSVYGISSATSLAVEQIREMLASPDCEGCEP